MSLKESTSLTRLSILKSCMVNGAKQLIENYVLNKRFNDSEEIFIKDVFCILPKTTLPKCSHILSMTWSYDDENISTWQKQIRISNTTDLFS